MRAKRPRVGGAGSMVRDTSAAGGDGAGGGCGVGGFGDVVLVDATFLNEALATTPQHPSSFLGVQGNPGSRQRALLQFSGAASSDCCVASAALRVRLVQAAGSAPPDLAVHFVHSDWDPLTATWDLSPSIAWNGCTDSPCLGVELGAAEVLANAPAGIVITIELAAGPIDDWLHGNVVAPVFGFAVVPKGVSTQLVQLGDETPNGNQPELVVTCESN